MAEPAVNLYHDEPRYETHDGKIVFMAPSASPDHGFVVINVASIFKNFLKGKPCWVLGDNSDVHLSDKDIFRPDVSVICNKDILKKGKGIYGAPDLVVEILSPRTMKYDRNYKKNVYEKAGVKEFWIIDPSNRAVEVYLLKDGKYELDNVYVKHDEGWIARTTQENRDAIIYEFKTSIFDDLIIKVEDVFENISF